METLDFDSVWERVKKVDFHFPKNLDDLLLGSVRYSRRKRQRKKNIKKARLKALQGFPRNAFDDQVDAMTYVWASGRKALGIPVEIR